MTDFLDGLDSTFDSVIADVEQWGWSIASKGDALLGVAEFCDVNVLERIRAVLGFHDETAGIRRRYDLAPRMGDVIGVSRGWFDHYGVYIGRQRVIHYRSSTGDISDDAQITQTSFQDFLRDESRSFVLEFPENKGHSPFVTVKRAQSQIGKMGYDLHRNNCEHFAFWCKTGELRSLQIDRLNELLEIHT